MYNEDNSICITVYVLYYTIVYSIYSLYTNMYIYQDIRIIVYVCIYHHDDIYIIYNEDNSVCMYISQYQDNSTCMYLS